MSVDTMANASAEELHRIVGAVLDEVALGYVLLSPRVKRMPPLWSEAGNPRYFRKAGAMLETDREIIRLSPPFHILPAVRSEVIQLRRITYSNPLELLIGGLIVSTAGLLASIVTLIDKINMMEANRQVGMSTAELTIAQADQTRQQTGMLIERHILEQRTLEVSIEEKEILNRRLAFELEVDKQKHQRDQATEQRIEDEHVAAAMTEFITAAKIELTGPTTGTVGALPWPDANIGDLLVNSRLQGSIEAMGTLQPRLEVVHEYNI